jgi:large subunit ribosomal protein L17
MRHRKNKKSTGKGRSLDNSIIKNQAVSLILHEKIQTTLARAKNLRGRVERLITVSKNQNLQARRRLISSLPKMGAVRKLMEELAPRYKERMGGYTRIRKVGTRKGDGAEIAQIELV